ncbi:DUF1127 domain-containing protein [Acuticoccus sp. M5D2P5]|uniref:DUF1127 domain-containing protein n=1 Tax=Acuticoccus kalidii TaxID=2910977 RepID=UPI001F44C0FE|nr:DUF1127 domain-containing protein [Acuticoccus kalidii]MCF3934121.1 DUF1127 domain-containing protein [Acuticoccus kalidii]
MNVKTLTLVAVPAPVPQHPSHTNALGRIRARLSDLWRAGLERARRRRQARRTAAALEHLSPRELRDIGLVRLSDASRTRYVSHHDFG